VMQRGNATGRPLWLITKHDASKLDVLTIDLAGGVETLAVFSFGEEAEMFLRFAASGEGWEVRQTSVGELVSVLYGPCSKVKRVALDPLPEICGWGQIGLPTMRREEYVFSLLNEGEPATPHLASGTDIRVPGHRRGAPGHPSRPAARGRPTGRY
jgi:hypothetical protein